MINLSAKQGDRYHGRSHLVDVSRSFADPFPFGWQIYKRGSATGPVRQSLAGYKSETEAWSAGGSALTKFLAAARNQK
jgi:hypothetical protein